MTKPSTGLQPPDQTRAYDKARRSFAATVNAETVNLAVDANGVDLGPSEVAAGAALVVKQGLQIQLYGPAAELPSGKPGIAVVDAPQSIAKAANPALAVRSTPQASVVRATQAVA